MQHKLPLSRRALGAAVLLVVALLLSVMGRSALAAGESPRAEGQEPTARDTGPLRQEATETSVVRATPTLAPVPCETGGEASIQGIVYIDENADGAIQPGEPFSGVVVSLQAPDGSIVLDTTTSGTGALGKGIFCFDRSMAPAGSYRLEQDKLQGFETTGGQERLVTVNETGIVQVEFPNVNIAQQATATATATADAGRATPTFSSLQ